MLRQADSRRLRGECLIHLQATVLFPPAIVRLLGDAIFPARYRLRLAVGNRDRDLPQQAHDSLSSMILSLAHNPLLIYVAAFRDKQTMMKGPSSLLLV